MALSYPLRRLRASCSETGSTNEFEMRTHGKHGKKIAPPKTHHEIHTRPATATNSRRRAAKHVPRVSPCSPASIDPGFVQIGLVQLSRSVKKTNVTHTTHTGSDHWNLAYIFGANGAPTSKAVALRLQGWHVFLGQFPYTICLLYTSPSPRDQRGSRMPSSA